MRCVTGKIMPGRISAVMGPSGAGKTTFLSAVVGKDSGCVRSGLILINGKDESIRAYQKIIGFVPQDDIVHGNLTVEENLRFSARCRYESCLQNSFLFQKLPRSLLNYSIHISDCLFLVFTTKSKECLCFKILMSVEANLIYFSFFFVRNLIYFFLFHL